MSASCAWVLAACLGSGPMVERGPGDGLSLRNGVLFREGAPFSGIVRTTWENGTPRTLEPYLRGKKHGEEIEYYPSGKLRWKRPFRRGVKEGRHVGWWENGRKMFEYRFHKGEYAGTTREWYPTGAPAREGRYLNGVEAGLQRAWRENGTLYSNYEARGGRNYGVVNARMCYSVKDGRGAYASGR
jgi:antitoxin component YwqK of YwqJK toxin-antitoxin module